VQPIIQPEGVYMVTQRTDEPTARSHSVVDVRVVRAAKGGWDVIVRRGGRVLSIQHCDDWHRAERALQRTRDNARLHRVEAA
jgi:hypothetical protein